MRKEGYKLLLKRSGTKTQQRWYYPKVKAILQKIADSQYVEQGGADQFLTYLSNSMEKQEVFNLYQESKLSVFFEIIETIMEGTSENNRKSIGKILQENKEISAMLANA